MSDERFPGMYRVSHEFGEFLETKVDCEVVTYYVMTLHRVTLHGFETEQPTNYSVSVCEKGFKNRLKNNYSINVI